MAFDVDSEIDGIIQREGGYVFHPHDKGGPTRWGVTEATARRHGYLGDMRELPLATAREIYRAEYWQQPGFARVAVHAPIIAAELFDTGVNMGPGVAVRFFQRALNVLTTAELKVDGQIGPRSVEALQGYLSKRRHQDGEGVLLKVMEALQGHRYVELVEQRSQNRSFVFGWFAHRIGQAA